MRKTHNQTRDSARNDPINRQIKGFSFRHFKDDCRHSRGEFSLFFHRNLIFNHSLDVELILDEEEMRDSWIEMSKQFDSSKHPRKHFSSKNLRINRQIWA